MSFTGHIEDQDAALCRGTDDLSFPGGRPGHQRRRNPRFRDLECGRHRADRRQIDVALERADVTVETVDSVFMTGGTSYVPSVRRLFEQRFGHEKLRYGDAFNSDAMPSSMPMNALKGDHPDYCLPLDEIGYTLIKLVGLDSLSHACKVTRDHP
jgi:hypothetical protein